MDYAKFCELLLEATSSVSKPYFRLPTYNPETPNESVEKWRERVYCYELYHQTRIRLDDIETDLIFQGEVDKKTHPQFGIEAIKGVKPDFLYHIPGAGTEGNFVVIEVGSINNVKEKFQSDVLTLKNMMEMVGYRFAIMLIFGDGKNETKIKSVKEYIEKMKPEITLVWHKEANRAATII
jgi:hypothetical protein